MTSLSEIANVLGFDKKTQYDTHTWGTVKSINSDGSYQVQLNASTVYTRCAKLCFANVGDRVFVCILANGTCAAIARLGGSDSSAIRGINITSGKANDTREFWKKQPNGTYYFNATNMLNGQPAQYGFLIHCCYGNEIHQEFWWQSNGPHYRRGANGSVTDMPGFYRITDDSQNPALLRYYNDSTHGSHAGLVRHNLDDGAWIRTPKPGLLPWDNTGGGLCDLGSGTAWQFRGIYGKNIYKNGRSVEGYTILYNNDSTGAGAGVTLSETSANFSRLDIYTKNDGNYHCSSVNNPNGKTAILLGAWANFSAAAEVKMMMVKISGTSITKTGSSMCGVNASGTTRYSNNNYLSIVRVVGYV